MGKQLVMDLTGESRVTQVQPPIGAWVKFFEIDEDAPGNLELRNALTGKSDSRPVVHHDHTWTVEIPESACDRPAIIRFQKTGNKSYDFWIIESDGQDYQTFEWILANVDNPDQRHGRRWHIL
jgi:hypothetical protein